MPEGPLGGSRPFVKTRLKYDVTVHIPVDILENPPKAREVLNVRVNMVQADVIEKVKQDIGKVILAANRLDTPSETKLIESGPETDTPLAESNEVEFVWTYIVDGEGIGEFADNRVSLTSANKMHSVLIEGDDSAISNAAAIREFDSGPIDINRVDITTD